MMKSATILFGLALGLVFASPEAFAQRAPTQSCNQTLDRCVADRVAHGSRASSAQRRCAEILDKCKKRN